MKHLNEDDVRYATVLLTLFGIAAETEELTTQDVVDATIAISTFISDRACDNAKRESERAAQATVPQ